MLHDGPAGRPDHPDFWRLSQQVLRRDGAAQEAKGKETRDAVWDRFMAEVGIDTDSLMYMAAQRAMRVLGITTTDELVLHSRSLSALTVVYLEGFQMGAEYEHDARTYNRKARS